MLRLLVFGIACWFPAGMSLSLAAVAQSPQTADQGVQITSLTNRLRVDLNGKLFTEYYFRDVPRPFCYPILGPDGLAMTRNWPMQSTPNEAHDHPHHRSFWFAHGSVNGHDFWSEEKDFGKTLHDSFIEVKSGLDSGLIRSRNNWIAADGALVCKDERLLKFHNPKGANERVVDFEITLFAQQEPLVLGDTKEGTMAVRLAETMRLHGEVGHGHIVNSQGARDDNTWGKRADWCDYYGPVEGRTVGLAIFDHPQNPRHPTWWHVRDYGLFAANPFGQHDFEKLRDKSAGNLTVPAGQSITFRYRFYWHQGDERQAKVAERYLEYSK